MGDQGKLSEWLEDRCHREHLSLRKAAAKTGLSHATIRDIINGSGATPETIRKLVAAFGGGENQRFALEGKLLVLAGYRTERPREKLSEPLAQLIDKVREFDEAQIKVMGHFADFLAETEGKD